MTTVAVLVLSWLLDISESADRLEVIRTALAVGAASAVGGLRIARDKIT